MSTNANLHRRLLDAQYNNDLSSMRDAFNDWQKVNCLHPNRVLAFDSHTQTKRFIDVACGNCPHCVQSKINEWVTRMYAHVEDFKHVYFITLTYRSFYSLDRPVNRLIIDKLKDALWHYDDFNENRRLGWNPSVLCKSHYQNFLKRLRANTGFDDITYVLSGEFGKRFGRPHFHMILFSNHEINRSDIVRAWSVGLFKRDNGEYVFRRNHKRNGIPLDFPIGRVDFHNLVTNGTFNTTAKIKVDGNFMNARNCFGYVCKYVCKRDHVNYKRVRLAYNALFKSVSYVDVFGHTVCWDTLESYLLDYGYDIDDIPNQINFLNKYKYEKIEFCPNAFIYSHGLLPTKSVKLFGFSADVSVLPSLYFEFRKQFSPFCEFSRGTPIGSIYATRHLPEFKKQVFNRPILQDTGFVVPAYFRRKAKNDLYGFRVCRQTFKSRSFALGGLLDLRRCFYSCLQNHTLPIQHFYSSTSVFTIEQALQDSHRYFADVGAGTRIIFCDEMAISFVYNRHLRKFLEVDRCNLDLFLQRLLISIDLELERHECDVSRANESALHLSLSKDIINTSMSFDSLRDTFEAKLYEDINSRQTLYDLSHKSLE